MRTGGRADVTPRASRIEQAPAPDTIARMSAPDYRFATRAKWVFGHLIALTAIAVFVVAGLWQLSRLDDRRDENDLLTTRAMGDPVPLPAVSDVSKDPGRFEWLLVEFNGTWHTDEEVILRARSLGGVSGHDVLTPAVSGGLSVIVDRGWVPIDVEGPPVAVAAPATEAATVQGVLRLTQERGSFGPVDPPEGVLTQIARVDLERLEPQVSGTLYPMWVQLLDQDPPPTAFPRIRPLPELGEGPHLSYAVQWFIFAGIVIVGYPILLRRTARSRSAL